MNNYTNQEKTCPACLGAKIQMNKDGIRVLCPVCSGKGMLRPWWQPYYETVTVTTSPNIKYQIHQ